MKKKFIRATFVAAIAMVCGINVLNSQKSETLSEVALANVEALADKTPSSSVTCKEDPGDRCLVGITPVDDWDECEGWGCNN